MEEFMGMINKELNNLITLFNNIENNRQDTLLEAIYDGGLTQTVVYLNNKYGLSIGLPIIKIPNNQMIVPKARFLNIPGNTLLQICNNSFNKNQILVADKKNDMFLELYLKKYYFYNQFYNFEEIMTEFRSMRAGEKIIKKSSTVQGVKVSDAPIDPDPRFNTPEWLTMLPMVLLGILALKEKPSLGVKNESELDTYMVYINKIIDDFITEYKNKAKFPDYYFILWVNQILNTNATSIKNTYYDVVNDLLKEYVKNGNTLKKLDYGGNTLIDYHYNLMCFGIIKDYFLKEENKLYFYQRSIKSETFDNINLSIEGFENKDNENKDNENKDNENKDKKNKRKKEKKKEPRTSTPKFLLYCLIFGCVVLLGTVIIIIFWKILINLYNKKS